MVALVLQAAFVKKTRKANTMKSKGLGDTIEKITKATKIKALVDKLPGDCGCNKRKEVLNKAFPYKQKPNSNN